MIHRQTMRRSGGSSRQGRALFSFLFFEKLVNSLVSRVIERMLTKNSILIVHFCQVEELESKVAQLESQSSLSVDVEGGIQSYSAAQVSYLK